MPGGEGGTTTFFASSESNYNVYLDCPGKTFSTNITGASIFRCTQGIWQNVPDCVGYIPKNGSCPIGYFTVVKGMSTPLVALCGKCPRQGIKRSLLRKMFVNKTRHLVFYRIRKWYISGH